MNTTDMPIPYDNLTNSVCSDFYSFFDTYLKMTFGMLGFFLNTACVAIFVEIMRTQRTSEHLFKYFLVKSITDTFLALLYFLYALFSQSQAYSIIERSYTLHLVHFINSYYLLFSMQLLSIFCELAACFSRYRKSAGKFKILDKLSYKVVIFLMFIYSFGFYSYKFASNHVIEIVNNGTEVTYAITSSELNKTMGYIHSFVRDGLCVLIIIVLNVLTVVQIKTVLSKKRTLVKSHTNERTNNAEIRLALMVLTMSTLAFIGHGLILIGYLNPEENNFFLKPGCYRALAEILYWLAYEVNFFFYYLFNLNFRRILRNYFRKISNLFRFNKNQ